MANGGTDLLTAQATPRAARRAWPRWLALGLTMIAVAVVSVVWEAAGARLLLGAAGLFLLVRGVLLVRGARAGALGGALADRARALGPVAIGAGVLAFGVAATSAGLAGGVLLVGVPVALLAGAAALLARRGLARRGGQALLVWSVLVTGLLVATGLGQSWVRAADLATVVAALAVAVLGVPLVLGAVNLRTVAAQPDPAPAPAPARPAGCAGCACGAGGCGAG